MYRAWFALWSLHTRSCARGARAVWPWPRARGGRCGARGGERLCRVSLYAVVSPATKTGDRSEEGAHTRKRSTYILKTSDFLSGLLLGPGPGAVVVPCGGPQALLMVGTHTHTLSPLLFFGPLFFGHRLIAHIGPKDVVSPTHSATPRGPHILHSHIYHRMTQRVLKLQQGVLCVSAAPATRTASAWTAASFPRRSAWRDKTRSSVELIVS